MEQASPALSTWAETAPQPLPTLIDERLAHYAAHPPEPRAATAADTEKLDALLRATLREVWG